MYAAKPLYPTIIFIDTLKILAYSIVLLKAIENSLIAIFSGCKALSILRQVTIWNNLTEIEIYYKDKKIFTIKLKFKRL